MAERNDTKLQCRFGRHNSYYQFYCQECKECICNQCLDEFHEDHIFCKLSSAEDDMKYELRLLVEETGDKFENLNSLERALEAKLQSCLHDKAETILKIEEATNDIMCQILESRKSTLLFVDRLYEEILQKINAQLEKCAAIRNIALRMENSTVDLNHIIGYFVGTKEVVASCADICSNKIKSEFIPNDSKIVVGKFDGELDERDNELEKRRCSGQGSKNIMQNNTDISFNCNRAECDKEEDNSSDEVHDLFPMVISNKQLTSTNKIVPISHDEAWLIIGKNLRKVKEDKVEDTVYAKNVKDFSVSVDRGVYLAKENDSFVRKLVLDDYRMVPVADVGEVYGLFPYNVNVLKNELVVNVCTKTKGTYDKTFHCILFFTMDGVIKHKVSLSLYGEYLYPKFSIHVEKTESESLHYCVFENSDHFRHSTIDLVHSNLNAGKITETFRGAIGQYPVSQFICGGACIDEHYNVLVSDLKHQCVYALCKNLKYKKMVLRNDEFQIKSPRAIAVRNELLWVSDVGRIVKFKYDSKQIALCK